MWYKIQSHVNDITRTALFQLRDIAKIRKSLHSAEKLVHALFWLDNCNALWSGCSSTLINSLYLVQNAANRVFTRTRRFELITPILPTLHVLPVKFCIDYTTLILTFRALDNLVPHYLNACLDQKVKDVCWYLEYWRLQLCLLKPHSYGAAFQIVFKPQIQSKFLSLVWQHLFTQAFC